MSDDKVPEFPKSAPASELSAGALIDALPSGERASDFQWLSLKTWNPTAEVSRLDGALVVGFVDYHDELRRFYGFAGGVEADAVASALLDAADGDARFLPELGLVPEATADRLGAAFETCEERDHFDYLFDAVEAATLPGNPFRVMRNDLSRFRRRFAGAIEVDVVDPSEAEWDAILDLTASWAAQATDQVAAHHELAALTRCVEVLRSGAAPTEVLVAVLRVEGRAVGFDITEITPEGWAIDHFRHTPHHIVGAQAHLRTVVAQRLADQGVREWNAEQDLGLPGLRARKMKDRPSGFVRKFQVRRPRG